MMPTTTTLATTSTITNNSSISKDCISNRQQNKTTTATTKRIYGFGAHAYVMSSTITFSYNPNDYASTSSVCGQTRGVKKKRGSDAPMVLPFPMLQDDN